MKLLSKLLDNRGTAIVEFAVVVPVLGLLTVGLAEFGLAYYAQSQVAVAAQTGLRYAYANGYNSTAVASAVTASSTQLTINATPAPSSFCGCVVSNAVTSVSCSSTCSSGGSPRTYVSVSAQTTYTPPVSLPGLPASYILSSTAQGRLN
jgi:Flp pilus assembly protein TadG